jgi:hypothetical protein
VRSLSLCEVDIHVEVLRMEYEPVGARRTIAYGETGGKRSDDGLGEPSANSRDHGSAATLSDTLSTASHDDGNAVTLDPRKQQVTDLDSFLSAFDQ